MDYLITPTDRNFYAIVAIGMILLFVLLRLYRWTKLRIVSGNVRKVGNIIAQYKRTFNMVKTAEFNNTPTFTLNKTGDIIYANERCVKNLGWNEDDNIKSIIAEAYLEDLTKFMIFHSDGEEVLNVEAKKKNGILFPAEVSIGKSFDTEDKENELYIVSLRDITHRRKNEETARLLREEIYKLSHLCVMGELVLCTGSWYWDMVEDNVEHSEGFDRIFGIKKEDSLTAQDLMNRVYIKDRQKVNDVMIFSAQSLKPYTVEYRILQLNGRLDLVRCSATVKTNKLNKAIGFQGGVLLLKKDISDD